MDNKRYWIGFDLGGTKMLALVMNEDFAPVARKRKRTRGYEGVNTGLSRICELIDRSLEEIGADASQLAGIGIGCPGPVQWQKGVVTLAVNLGWKNVAVGEYLRDRYKCHVSVLNDVDAGVYGEYRFGAAKDARCTVGIFPGTGIGGGCVYEGKILRGTTLTCMEVGHMRISSSPRYSGIEMAGTLESEASRLNIAAECAKLAFRGEAPNLMEIAGADLQNIRSKSIAEAIQRGDKQVERVVQLAAHQIGIGVVNLIHILSPDVIVMGGGLVEALPNLILDEVRKTAKRYVLDCYVDRFKIQPAKLGDDAAALGAAAWAALESGEATDGGSAFLAQASGKSEKAKA